MYDHSNITFTQVLEYATTIHTDLQFKPTPQTNVSINFLDLLLHRTNHGLAAEVYRKHTSTDTTIHHNSNRPIEHNLAADRFLPNRINQLPLTPPYKQQERNTIQHNAKANAFPHALLLWNSKHRYRKISRYHLQKSSLTTATTTTTTTTTPKTWVTCTYFKPRTNIEVNFAGYLCIYILRTCLKWYHRMCMLYVMAFDAENPKRDRRLMFLTWWSDRCLQTRSLAGFMCVEWAVNLFWRDLHS